jgi:outer membrane lipoprotein-sorting protein
MLKISSKFRLAFAVAFVAAVLSGCAASTKTVVKPANAPVPSKTASKAELIDQYDRLANSIHSLNLTVTIRLTAGSAYTGTIEQYHEINGFILAEKPSMIRVIGQVPVVGKNIFDMESNGQTFHIFIPSKNQFLEGPAKLERPSAKPIENLRPQHLLDAIFWREIPKGSPVLLEETSIAPSNFYVLTVIRPANRAESNMDWEIDRKIWFDRADLSVSRIDTYDSSGKPETIVHLNNWDMFGSVRYPKQIVLDRPQNDYQLQLGVTKVTANEEIAPERFALAQPPGTELVRVGQETASGTPGEKRP